MIHYVFVGMTFLVGSLGVVGTIAAIAGLIFLGPSAVLAIVEPLFAKFIACTKCVVSVAVTLALLAAYWIGHHEAENECRAASAAFEAAQVQRDARIAADTKLWVTKQIADDFMAEQEGQKDVTDFKNALPAGVKCPVGDRADQLRHIAGQTVGGPSKGMPKVSGRGAGAGSHPGFRLPGLGAGSSGGAREGKPAK